MNPPPALIVTFNPLPIFFSELDLFYDQLNQIIIIDNGSDSEVRHLLDLEAKKRSRSLTVLFNDSNLGMATALNQGFQWAISEGHHHIVSFDQDSRPAFGMVSALQDVLAMYSDDRLAIVAPVVGDLLVNNQARYLRSKNTFFFERVSCTGNVLDNVTSVITSGALYDLAVYQEIGPFRDEFFIDYVDTEYCLRARKNGFKIFVACDAFLKHRLGNRQRRSFLGQYHYPTFHSPLRWYYIGRNRIQMLKNYSIRFPHWLTYEIVASVYMLIRMLLFETKKIAKIRALIRGTWDGVLGRMGRASETLIKQLER